MKTKLCLDSGCSSSRSGEVLEHAVDAELWHACSGKRVKIPAINSIIFYFPEGHAEHAGYPLDNLLQAMNASPPPPYVPCRVASRKRMADPESDEVFVKIGLVPITQNPELLDCSMKEEIMEDAYSIEGEAVVNSVTFAKTLTPSDADNSSSFTVPRQCAERIFPKLDSEQEPPTQIINCRDVHGNTWSFRHVFRGSPKRHLLNGGWSKFAVSKKLEAGDVIVFLRKESGEVHVGIRRSMKEGAKLKSRIKIRKEAVIESITKACEGEAFEVEYYPRAAGGSTLEYWVKASQAVATTKIAWRPGMRVKMAVESEDQLRINWFMGTIVLFKNHWKKLQWRQLEVTWDNAATERRLEDLKRVNPWMVEPVSTILPMLPDLHTAVRISSCLPPYDFLSNSACPPLNVSSDHQFQLPSPRLLPLLSLGVQGSRHNDHSSPNFHFKDDDTGRNDAACVLTIGQYSHAPSTSTPPPTTAATLRLFGKTVYGRQG